MSAYDTHDHERIQTRASAGKRRNRAILAIALAGLLFHPADNSFAGEKRKEFAPKKDVYSAIYTYLITGEHFIVGGYPDCKNLDEVNVSIFKIKKMIKEKKINMNNDYYEDITDLCAPMTTFAWRETLDIKCDDCESMFNAAMSLIDKIQNSDKNKRNCTDITLQGHNIYIGTRAGYCVNKKEKISVNKNMSTKVISIDLGR